MVAFGKRDKRLYRWLSVANIALLSLASGMGWLTPGMMTALLVLTGLAIADFILVNAFKVYSLTFGWHSIMSIITALITVLLACYMAVGCGHYGTKLRDGKLFNDTEKDLFYDKTEGTYTWPEERFDDWSDKVKECLQDKDFIDVTKSKNGTTVIMYAFEDFNLCSPCAWLVSATFAALAATIIETYLLQIGMRSGFQNVRLVVAQLCGSKQDTATVSPEQVSSTSDEDSTEKKTD